MVIQAIELDDDFEVPEPIPDPSKTEAFYPRSQILYPINGLVDPTITMHPGEVQRWRIAQRRRGQVHEPGAGRARATRPRLGRPDPRRARAA